MRRPKLGEPRTQRSRLAVAIGALAFEHGPASLTVDRICEQAGMSRRSFYDPFANADDALASAVEDAHERLWDEVAQQMQTAVAPDWPAAISRRPRRGGRKSPGSSC